MAFEQTNGLIASEHAVTNIPLQLISCCYLRKEEHMQTSEQVACTADNSRMLQAFIASSKVLHHELEYVGGANLTIPIIGESERGKELSLAPFTDCRIVPQGRSSAHFATRCPPAIDSRERVST